MRSYIYLDDTAIQGKLFYEIASGTEIPYQIFESDFPYEDYDLDDGVFGGMVVRCYCCGKVVKLKHSRPVFYFRDYEMEGVNTVLEMICPSCYPEYCKDVINNYTYLPCDICKRLTKISAVITGVNNRPNIQVLNNRRDSYSHWISSVSNTAFVNYDGTLNIYCPSCKAEEAKKPLIECGYCGGFAKAPLFAINVKDNRRTQLCLNCYSGRDGRLAGDIFIGAKKLNYSWIPPVFYARKLPTENNPLYYGTELEVSYKTGALPNLQHENESIREIIEYPLNYDGQPFFYCKYDASVNGFEIVTMPFTWFWYKKNRQMFDVLWKQKSNHWTADHSNTCGMHIHASKAKLSSLTIYKLGCFVNKNKTFISKMSSRRRGLNQYCTLMDSSKLSRDLSKSSNKFMGGSHHSALATSNRRTVELRIFQGTLSPVMYEANLGFYNALIEFCENTPVQIFANPRKMTGYFKRYVKGNREYECLNHKINYLGL